MRTARRRGADTGQSLLYAMFAVMVFLGVMTLYKQLRINTMYKEAVQNLTYISEEGRQLDKAGYRDSALSQAIMNKITESGLNFSTSAWNVTYSGSPTIAFGLGVFYTGDTSDVDRKVCNRLTGHGAGTPNGSGYVQNTIDSGPLGSNYFVLARCNVSNPVFVVYYYR